MRTWLNSSWRVFWRRVVELGGAVVRLIVVIPVYVQSLSFSL